MMPEKSLRCRSSMTRSCHCWRSAARFGGPLLHGEGRGQRQLPGGSSDLDEVLTERHAGEAQEGANRSLHSLPRALSSHRVL